MKKTIIAASVAALVAAPAFADVKISGNVIQEFVSNNASGLGASGDQGLDSEAAVDLVFSVSEDLGNGMSAFAKIHQLSDDGSGSQGPADQVVGIKGDFGTIVAGRMESFTEGKVSAMGAVDSSDTLSIEVHPYATSRADGALAYVSPSFNGFTFGIAGFAMNNTGAAESSTSGTLTITGGTINLSQAATNIVSGPSGSVTALTVSSAVSTLNTTTTTAAVATNESGNFDAIDMMVEYANGPLLVRLSRETTDAGTFNAGNEKQKTTALGINYKLGDVTLAGTYYDVENGDGVATNDVSGYFVGAKTAMGANTFSVSYMEVDDLDSDGNKETGAEDSSWMVSVDHALSKRTSLTAAYQAFDEGTASSADTDSFAVGIKHVF
jgi:predicted porin